MIAEKLRKLRTVDATENAAIAVKKGVIFGEQDSWGKIKDFFTAILSQRRGKGRLSEGLLQNRSKNFRYLAKQQGEFTE
ncbi:hypothetical protein HMSSN036_84090 [Paenibacillus macerans]|nr:hypothetical protein HMSSN036_84090 [Paenibacillus macerans]